MYDIHRGRLMRRLAVLLIILLALPAVADTTIFRRAAAAPPAGTDFNDDFEADTSANWDTNLDAVCGAGGWAVSGGALTEVTGTNAACALYEVTELDDDDGRACIEENNAASNTGIKFRMNSTDSGVSYTVRTNGGATIVWRYCNGSSCSDIESAATDVTTSDCVCIQWAGTGTDTTVKWWELEFADCPATGATTGANTTTAEWDADATSSGTFTANPGSEANGGAGSRYVGVYDGGSNEGSIEEFWAWSD